MNDQGMWCTLKEYQKINNFAKSNTLRHLQELAKKGALLSPSRKKDPLRKTGAYLVNVTDQSEINRLLVLRATQKDRNAKSKTPARKRRIDIQVLEGSGEEYVLSNRQIRKHFEAYLEGQSRATCPPPKAVPIRRHTITLTGTALECVSRYAQANKKPVSDSYVEMVLQYARTDEGKTAIFLATNGIKK